MLHQSIPLWGGLALLFSVGTAAAQTSTNAFAASTSHTLSIQPDGSLWASGLNLEGQLGDGTTTSRTTPVRVMAESPSTRWAQVAAGTSHTLALTTDGRLYTWGSNSEGQLGDGTTKGHLAPAPVVLPEAAAHATWKQIAAGTSYSLALTSDGHLYAWGNNNSGELGNGSSLDKHAPVEIALPASAGNTAWAQVAAGNNHTMALTTDGRLYAWGSNTFGQLGTGSGMPSLEPVAVGATRKRGALRWKQVAAGRYHTLAIAENGRLYAWGSNRFGQLGEEVDTQRDQPTAVALPGHLARTVWAQVAGGDAHSLAMTADGQVFAWGNNCAGQLGDGTVARQFHPVQVLSPTASNATTWAQIASGGFHTLGVSADGQLYAWGANRFGQLGDGSVVDQRRPLNQHGALTSQAKSGRAKLTDTNATSGAAPAEQNDNRYLNQVPEPPR